MACKSCNEQSTVLNDLGLDNKDLTKSKKTSKSSKLNKDNTKQVSINQLVTSAKSYLQVGLSRAEKRKSTTGSYPSTFDESYLGKPPNTFSYYYKIKSGKHYFAMFAKSELEGLPDYTAVMYEYKPKNFEHPILKKWILKGFLDLSKIEDKIHSEEINF